MPYREKVKQPSIEESQSTRATGQTDCEKEDGEHMFQHAWRELDGSDRRRDKATILLGVFGTVALTGFVLGSVGIVFSLAIVMAVFGELISIPILLTNAVVFGVVMSGFGTAAASIGMVFEGLRRRSKTDTRDVLKTGSYIKRGSAVIATPVVAFICGAVTSFKMYVPLGVGLSLTSSEFPLAEGLEFSVLMALVVGLFMAYIAGSLVFCYTVGLLDEEEYGRR